MNAHHYYASSNLRWVAADTLAEVKNSARRVTRRDRQQSGTTLVVYWKVYKVEGTVGKKYGVVPTDTVGHRKPEAKHEFVGTIVSTGYGGAI